MWEGAARAWYMPDSILSKSGLKSKYVFKGDVLELSPYSVIYASCLSNLPLFTLPASYTDPLCADLGMISH